MDLYKTLSSECQGLFKDKGSKFISYAYPFDEESELKNIVNKVKDMHPKARHHCWAYRISTDLGNYRVQDDGEPSGTAGRPILNVLLSQELTNVIVIVVRYFGGTLLGVPGLINAYKKATLDALSNAIIIEKTINDYYQLQFDYLQMNDIMRILKQANIQPEKQSFGLKCLIRFGIRKEYAYRVKDDIMNLDDVLLKYLYTK